MDGDVFGKVSRIGRRAAEAVSRALDGDAWEPFFAERCLDALINAAGGVPSLPGVLRELRNHAESPLLSRVLCEDTSHRIAAAVADAKGGVVDLILKNVAQKCVFRGMHNEREILTRFAEALLDRAIITGRGGLLEHQGTERLSRVRTLLSPVAAAAAEVLQRRPDAKRLGLARRHAPITPETDLLGGSE